MQLYANLRYILEFDVDHLNKMHRFELVMRAIKKLHNPPAKQRLPVVNGILLQIEPYVRRDTFNGKMLWAAFTFAVANMMRCGEFTVNNTTDKPRLTLADASCGARSFDEAQCISLVLKSTKTSYEPVVVRVLRTDAVTCPVRAIADYLNERHHRGFNAGHEFKPDEAFFVTEDGTPLTRKYLSNKMTIFLQKARVPEWWKYKGHSFRRGGATTLLMAGVSDSTIRNMGRWTSWCYQLYVDTPDHALRNAAVRAAQQRFVFGGLDAVELSRMPLDFSNEERAIIQQHRVPTSIPQLIHRRR